MDAATLARMSLLDLVCPSRCAGCGAPECVVCARCSLAVSAPPVRHSPTPCPPGMPTTWVVSAYDGPSRALLLAFKEQGAVGLAGILGDALARAVNQLIETDMSVVLVPAPSARSTVRRRGDDTTRLLAGQAARRLRTARRRVAVAPVLVQSRRVADSAGLTAAARAANLTGALAVRASAARRVRGTAVVLVDDLVTTGATLTEAAAALSRSGAIVVGAAAVAATQRRSNW